MQGRQAMKNLLDSGLAQTRKTLFLSLAADLGARTAFNDHFANGVGHIEEFVDSRAAAISRVITGIAADAAEKYLPLFEVRGGNSRFAQFSGRGLIRALG